MKGAGTAMLCSTVCSLSPTIKDTSETGVGALREAVYLDDVVVMPDLEHNVATVATKDHIIPVRSALPSDCDRAACGAVRLSRHHHNGEGDTNTMSLSYNSTFITFRAPSTISR